MPKVGRAVRAAVTSSPAWMSIPFGAYWVGLEYPPHTSPLIAATARWPSVDARRAWLVVVSSRVIRSPPSDVSRLIPGVPIATSTRLTAWVPERVVTMVPQSCCTPGATGARPAET